MLIYSIYVAGFLKLASRLPLSAGTFDAQIYNPVEKRKKPSLSGLMVHIDELSEGAKNKFII